MAAGDPTGDDLASGTTNGNTLPEYGDSWEEREITLGAGVELTSGTKYSIVARIAAPVGAAELAWAFSVNNPYTNTKLTVTALTTAPTEGSTVTQVTSDATMVVDYVNVAKTEIHGRVTSGTFVTTAGYTLSGGGMDPETRVPLSVADSSASIGDNYDSSDSGSSWTVNVDDDVWFKTKAGAVEKDTGTFDQDGFNRWLEVYGTVWGAQTFTASSTYTITSVVLKLAKYTVFGGTPETVTVSIRATDAGLPGKATTPVPADTAIDIRRNQLTVGWTAGADTDDYDVYFGLQGNPILQESAYVSTSWAIGGELLYNTVYEWRIDSNNDEGTTTGDTWLFTALVYAPPLPSGITLVGNSGPNGEGTPTGTPSGENNMLTIRRLCAAAENRFWYEDI